LGKKKVAAPEPHSSENAENNEGILTKILDQVQQLKEARFRKDEMI
jgi:hypothetical protein